MTTQFTILGAGPYGLAVSARLRSAGFSTRTFGRPMQFWDTRMPQGMLLRSPWSGSSIGDPAGPFSLDSYEAALGSPLPRQLPREDFVSYGRWVQRETLPDLDPRDIAHVTPASEGYYITLDDGETFHSHNVVIAAGIGPFACRPAVFDSLPLDLVSHTVDPVNANLARFRGRHVAVIGAGQSATESSAILAESGADVEQLIRSPQLRWLNSNTFLERLMDARFYPFKAPAKIGPIGINWLLEHPALFTAFPRELQDKMTSRALRPAASGWLRARVASVGFSTDRHIVSATGRNGKAHLEFGDGSARDYDHVLLGTGYKIDIRRYAFLSPALHQHIRTANGYPILNRGFECSLAGMYFVGTVAWRSFGPYVRFVAGSGYAANALSRHALGARRFRSHQDAIMGNFGVFQPQISPLVSRAQAAHDPQSQRSSGPGLA